jgi:hypothetical protein
MGPAAKLVDVVKQQRTEPYAGAPVRRNVGAGSFGNSGPNHTIPVRPKAVRYMARAGTPVLHGDRRANECVV